jgi:hypothetical protein
VRNPLPSSDRTTAMSGSGDGEREPIVYRPGQVMLASDVPLRRLNRGMSQKELDLL